MSKKVYIITACVFAVVILGCVGYWIFSSGERQAREELATTVREFNKADRLYKLENINYKSSKTFYDSQYNLVSVDYNIDGRYFTFYQYDLLDEHPDQKAIMRADLEKYIVRDEDMLPILKEIEKAGADLRIRFVDMDNPSQALVFMWDTAEIRKIINKEKK